MKNYLKHKMRSKNPIVIIGTILFIGILITAFILFFGYIIMYLWNWLMPEIFGLTTITFWQAIGLGLLSKLLLGGFGGDKHGKKNDKCHSRSLDNKSSKSDFSKWKHYGNFWEEEGEIAYKEYLNRKSNPENTELQNAEDE
ncbi:MAG: hypothetical protein JKY02_10650 [Flavobacteriaceae bacterium]|nr:hypothetical protein [Flavobacteriaceae bacterium]